MLVFLDTEFTDFIRPDLISIALLSEDGQEFYAERTNYCHADCSDYCAANRAALAGPRARRGLQLCRGRFRKHNP